MGRLTLKVLPNAKVPDIQFPAIPPSMGARAGPSGPGTPGRPAPGLPLLRVRLTSPPLDGRANQALEEWLSELSGFPVRIVHGRTSRLKTIEFAAEPSSFIEALRMHWEKEKGARHR